MNYGHLKAAWNWINPLQDRRKSVLWIELGFAVIATGFSSYYLWKIHEMPVSEIRIQTWHNCDTAFIDIKIVKDYDLKHRLSNDSIFRSDKHTGYMALSGSAYVKTPCQSVDYEDRRNPDVVNLLQKLKDNLDTIPEIDYSEVNSIFHIDITGSRRKQANDHVKTTQPKTDYSSGYYVLDVRDGLK